MTQPSLKDPAALGAFVRRHLLADVMPFWTRHAVDEAGGLNTCITDDGQVLSRDKWLWSQWRAVWVFSTLYRLVEPRDEWLDLARQIYRFAARHGWDEQVRGWRLLLGHDGEPLRGCESIYVDAFAIYGLTALARATGESEPLDLARKTADSVRQRLRQPHDQIPAFPYPVPAGARVHGIPMIFSLVLWELAQLADDTALAGVAQSMADEVVERFYQPELDVVVERIAADGGMLPAPSGTTVNPGHVIEDMWFQIHIARDAGHAPRIAEACRLIRRHLELGWDEPHGGLLHAIDVHGHEPADWPYPDAKLWWPHTEAMYALVLAHQHTGDAWCVQWYDRVHEYAFRHYPVPGAGEWTQKLDRRGEPMTGTVALPVKDPFHLPRALILMHDALRSDSPATQRTEG